MRAQTGVQVRPIVHHLAKLNWLVQLALMMGTLDQALLEGCGLEDLLVEEVLVVDAVHLQACPAIGGCHHVDAVRGTRRKAASVEGAELLTRWVSGIEAR